MTVAVGVDVGGSNIRARLVDVATGSVCAGEDLPTDAGRGGGVVLKECVNVAARLAPAGASPPVGVAVCELVDHDGAITSAATLDWCGLDVAGAFDPRAIVESDVRAAALAEARFGAGVGRDAFVYLNVGTGISFCLVTGGVPYGGARGRALVLGVPPVELTASGKAIAGGRPIAQAAADLGEAMAWLAEALDPEIIVVGGGLGLNDEYRGSAVAAMRAHVAVVVVTAALGLDAGAVGAAIRAVEGHA